MINHALSCTVVSIVRCSPFTDCFQWFFSHRARLWAIPTTRLSPFLSDQFWFWLTGRVSLLLCSTILSSFQHCFAAIYFYFKWLVLVLGDDHPHPNLIPNVTIVIVWDILFFCAGNYMILLHLLELIQLTLFQTTDPPKSSLATYEDFPLVDKVLTEIRICCFCRTHRESYAIVGMKLH